MPVISRKGDPHAFEISEASLSVVPEDIKGTIQETHATGGLNIYKDEALKIHHTERGEFFLYSIPKAAARRLLPEDILANFNFPGEPVRCPLPA